jgi:hypothetical protein
VGERVVQEHIGPREEGAESMGGDEVREDRRGLVWRAVLGSGIDEGALVGIGVLDSRLGNTLAAILHEADEARSTKAKIVDATRTTATGSFLIEKGSEELGVVGLKVQGLPRRASPRERNAVSAT